MRLGLLSSVRCFNSRARKGRDMKIAAKINRNFKFQFTRPQGARPYNRGKSSENGLFQFTRPQGARLAVFGRMAPFAGFNSRARKGRD